LTKIVFTVFHNRASDILRGSKQWWTLASKISRGPDPRTLEDRRLCNLLSFWLQTATNYVVFRSIITQNTVQNQQLFCKSVEIRSGWK